MLNPIPVEYVLSLHTDSPCIFRSISVFIFEKNLFSKRIETKLNKTILKVLLFPIFLEMKSHRAHEYVAAINLHSYILTLRVEETRREVRRGSHPQRSGQ
jgi:hypothetical protein